MCDTHKKFCEDKLFIIERAIKRVNGRKLRRREKKLQRKVEVQAANQLAFLIKHLEGIYQFFSKELWDKIRSKNQFIYCTKGFEDEIDDVFERLDDALMLSVILEDSAEAMEFGAKFRIKKMKLGQFGIDFSLSNPLATQYLESDRPLVLANMKETTKEHIKPLLIKAQEQGLSYTEVAKQISDNYAFSRARAQIIATTEIGNAYGHGNKVPMIDLQNEGFEVRKRWITAGAGRTAPRPEHDENEAQGWIPLDDTFRGDGADIAPEGINCRCDTLYDFD